MAVAETVEFFLPGPRFSWRDKVKTHKGKCPKRGHCTKTLHGQHPAQKGNSKQVVRRGRHVGITEGKRAIAAELALVAALEASPFRPPAPLGDVRLDVAFVFVPPSSWPKWKREAALLQVVRPTGHDLGDRGNYLKMVEDALGLAGFYEDDAKVVSGDVSKLWGTERGYLIKFEKLPHEPRTAVEMKRWTSGRRLAALASSGAL